MKQVVIENPVVNSPFGEPRRHFRFSDQGITNEIAGQRRSSAYFIPIAATQKKGKQLNLTADWLGDRVEENKFINQIPLPDNGCRLEEITTLAQKLPGTLDRPLNGLYHRFELNQDKPKAMMVLQLGTQRTEQGNFLMLDLDIGSLPNEIFVEAASIWSWLYDAHDRLDEAFFASVAPALLEKWKRDEK